MSQNLVPKLILEALGPAALCFFSIGAVIATQGQDLVAISIATGMAFAILVAVAGNISCRRSLQKML